MQKIVALLFIIVLISCSQSDTHRELIIPEGKAYVKITNKLDSLNISSNSKNLLTGELSSTFNTTLNKDEEVLFLHQSNTPTFAFIKINGNKVNLFIIPNDTLVLEYDRSIKIIGSNEISNINKYQLSKYASSIKMKNMAISSLFYSINSNQEFNNIIDSITSQIEKELNLAKEIYSLPNWYLEYARAEGKYASKHFLNTFGHYCRSTELRENVIIEDSLLQYLETYNFTDNSALLSNMYYYFLYSTFNVRFHTYDFVLSSATDEEINLYLSNNFNYADSLLEGTLKNIYKSRIISSLYKYSYSRIINDFSNKSHNDFFNSYEYMYISKIYQ